MGRKPVLILGLGNPILGDDGVGLRTARRVAELAGEAADHAEAHVATIDLLPLMEGYERVIVIDAYISEKETPGTTVELTPEDLPAGFGYRSFHTLPFREMLELGRQVGMDMPDEMSIHGLCVGCADTFGEAFTPCVEGAWRAWAEAIALKHFGVRPPRHGRD